MSIARAFTTRRVKQSIQAAEEKAPLRSNSTKVGTLRHQISSPINLIHTTNMLSYNAPDIYPMSASSTGSSQRSDDDMSDSALTNGTTPPTSPDIESPAKRSLSPEPNHLSCFFTVPPGQQAPAPAPAVQPEAPVIPQRAASHSKKQYNTLVRQRSASGMSHQSHRTVSTKASFTFSRSSSTSTSTSVSSTPMHHHHHHHKSKLSSTTTAPVAPAPQPSAFAPASPPRQHLPRSSIQHSSSSSSSRKESQQQQQHHHHHHPFGNELAQVSELAEEYGVKEQLVANVVDLGEHEMLQKGLLRFSADEYLSEVRGLFASFMVPPRPVAAAWI
ncbi:hypothetical protein C8A01DRAFT_44844 [Parachaetomium inaequale]|uniref:Uncharacterized protein n=1 Tax=Parachaetomium inaequale TaxID=2588326 RepID=A0AAN6STU4_9PEZI|nr:hypothetical protein C8A01DRAFT_44844 [Parachaetomium inaequale]